MKQIKIGTRKSKLALVQTHAVIQALKEAGASESFHVKEMTTKGDENIHVPLTSLGQGGVFLEEIEQQLIGGEIDFAVHSLKDVPVDLPEQLILAAIPKREDHRDVYIAKEHVPFTSLPPGSIIGTSSIRRAAQIMAARPDLETKWIRGPIDQRLKQLEDGKYDAIILAAAGLKRLGIDGRYITAYLSDETFMPAMGQGGLAVQCRKDDQETKALLSRIHDESTAMAVLAERALLARFANGDQAPIAAYARTRGEEIHLAARIFSLNGQESIHYKASGTDSYELALKVAEELKKQGAEELIQEAVRGLTIDE